MPRRPGRRSVTFQFTVEIHERAREACRLRGVSFTALASRAIIEYLDALDLADRRPAPLKVDAGLPGRRVLGDQQVAAPLHPDMRVVRTKVKVAGQGATKRRRGDDGGAR